MIHPKEIKQKAERKYRSFLESVVEDVPFSKIVIPGDKNYSKSSFQEFEMELLTLTNHSKEKKGFGYSLDFQKVRTRFLGLQDLPVSIYFESERDYLKFLGKEKEAERFRQNSLKIISTFPELREWVLQKPMKVVAYQDIWDVLLKVCLWFRANPNAQLYIRELPVKVHTKFIENHKGVLGELLEILIAPHINQANKDFEKRFNLKYQEPLVRFRILDSKISNSYFSGINDMAIPAGMFSALNLPVERVLVVENKTTLYTTLTLPPMEKTMAVFGSGFAVQNIKSANWLHHVDLYYWGDIDIQGFEILSQFRGYFPNAKSILMDKKTFDTWFENEKGTPGAIERQLNLNQEELQLYQLLKLNNWRLEQEKIPFDYANQQLMREL
jgi:hypothetical protein